MMKFVGQAPTPEPNSQISPSALVDIDIPAHMNDPEDALEWLRDEHPGRSLALVIVVDEKNMQAVRRIRQLYTDTVSPRYQGD